MSSSSADDFLESAYIEALAGGREPNFESWIVERQLETMSSAPRLAVVEFDHLWQQQQGVPVEVFLTKYPSLRGTGNVILQLIAIELRYMKGNPDGAAYCERFPEVAEEIRKLVELRELIGGISFSRFLSDAGTYCTLQSDRLGRNAAEFETDATDQSVVVTEEFRLVRKLASGHWKDTYEGLQQSTQQRVAVKLPRQAAERSAITSQMLREGRTQALLSHQSIPPIFAVRADDDALPVLVEKLIVGQRWSDSIDGLPLHENLRILLQVARAVAYAHSEHQVIHRDIKPDNVMLNEAFGEVYLVDWGLALRVGTGADAEHPTPHVSGASGISGTPSYMAPEMALGQPWNCSLQTDVFLLGGVLYHILTGSRPYAGSNVRDMLFAAARGDISPPEKRAPNRMIPVHLRRICLQALAFNREDRYANGGEFVVALESYLRHAGAERRCEIADERLSEVERHGDSPTLAPADHNTILQLIEIASEYRQVNDDALQLAAGNVDPAHAALARTAEHGESRARHRLFETALRAGDLGLSSAQLELLHERAPEVAGDLAPLVRKLERATRQRRRQMRAKWMVAALAASVIMATLIMLNESRRRALEEVAGNRARADAAQARVLHAESEKQKAEAQAEALRNRTLPLLSRAQIAKRQGFEQGAAAFFAEALRSDDQRSTRIALFESLQLSLTPQKVSPRRIIGQKPAFDSSGQFLVTIDRHPSIVRSWSVDSWTLETEKTIHEEIWVERPNAPGQYLSLITDCTALPGHVGEFLTSGADGNLCRFHALQGEVLETFPADAQRRRPVTCLAVTSKGAGELIIAAGDAADGSVTWWEWPRGKNQPILLSRSMAHPPIVLSVAFQATAGILASGGADGTVRLWQEPGKSSIELHIPPGKDEATPAARVVRFSPSGRWLAVGTEDNRILVWDLAESTPDQARELLGHEPDARGMTRINGLEFVSEMELVSAGSDGTVRHWQFGPTGASRILWRHQRNVLGYQQAIGLAVDLKKGLAATVGADGALIVGSISSGTILNQSFGTLENSGAAQTQVSAVAVNPVRGQVAMAGMAHDSFVRLVDLATMSDICRFEREPLQQIAEKILSPSALAISPDGQQMAVGQRDGTLELWDVATEKIVTAIPAHLAVDLPNLQSESPVAFLSLDWHPDGTRLASLGYDGQCKVWNAKTLEPIHSVRLLSGDVVAETNRFVPRAFFVNRTDNLLLLESTRISLWKTGADRPLDSFLPNFSSVSWTAAAISPDAHLLIAGSDDGMIQIRSWPGGQLVQSINADPLITDYSPYRHQVSEAVRFDGLDIRGRAKRLRTIQNVAISPDSRLFAAVLGDGTLRIFDLTTGRLLHSGAGHEFGLAAPSQQGVWFSPAGELHTWGSDGTLRSWDLNPFVHGRRDISMGERTIQIASTTSGRRLFVLDGEKRLWQLTTDDPSSVSRVEIPERVTAIASDANASIEQLYVATHDGRITTIDFTDKTLLRQFSTAGSSRDDLHGGSGSEPVTVLARQANGDLLASNRFAGGIDLWNCSTRSWMETIHLSDPVSRASSPGKTDGQPLADTRHVLSLCFSPDGPQLACADSEGAVGVWDSTEKTWAWKNIGPKQMDGITGLCFSPDGMRLAHAGLSPGIVIWDVASGRRLQTLLGHEPRDDFIWDIRSLAWSTTVLGDVLASTGGDGTIRLWHDDAGIVVPLAVLSTTSMDSYRSRMMPSTPESDTAIANTISMAPWSIAVNDVEFSPDGRRLFVGDDSPTLKVYELETIDEFFRIPNEMVSKKAKQILGIEFDGESLKPRVLNRLLPSVPRALNRTIGGE